MLRYIYYLICYICLLIDKYNVMFYLFVTYQQVCHHLQIHYTVYQRLSKLLRSLVSALRVADAYKLSRNQSSDTYVICYRIYTGRPDHSGLSTPVKEPTKYNIGSVSSPFGTISLRGVCRYEIY